MQLSSFMSSIKKIKSDFSVYDAELDKRIEVHNNKIQKQYFKELANLIDKLFNSKHNFEETSNISCAVVSFLSKSTRSRLPDVPIEGSTEFQNILKKELI